jgi:ferredoxin/thioredoxin reductase/pSer/pThr/pTyr-binding forkhead associated (FHA) protein
MHEPRAESGHPGTAASEEVDLLVVGGGPAGTAAAFRARELRIRVLVVDQDDVLTRIRDYAKGKEILPDFGGGDKMQFPDGGALIKDLRFEPIDKDAMHVHWKGLYASHGVPAKVGVELIGLEADARGLWHAKLWNSAAKREELVAAHHVALALGGGMPRRLDIPGDVKSIASRLDDAEAYVGGPACVIGGGTSAAEAVIAISQAKSRADDPTPVCWAYRGTKMPAVSRALADDLFAAYTQGGNIRYLPGSDPVSVSIRTDCSVLCLEVDRKELADRPTEVLHLEFLTSHCIACIGQEIPERFLHSLGVTAVVGGPRNKKGLVVSPLLETCRPNLYLFGDTLSPLYLEADDFQADPADFREIKRRGNVKAALRDGALVAEVVAQKLEGKTNIHVALTSDHVAAPPTPAGVGEVPGPPQAPPARQAFLVRLLRDGVEADEFNLTPNAVTTIGRLRADVSFPDDSMLSDRHATIRHGPTGYVLHDEGGDGGVFVRVSEDRPTAIHPGDIVNAGRQWLVFGGSGDLSFTHYGPTGRELGRYPLREGGSVAVGREADVVLDLADGSLSRRHVAASVRNGVISVRDLKSINGTFLKVEAGRVLEDGDEIRLGGQSLRFSLARESRPAMDVHFETPTAPAAIIAPAAAAPVVEAPAVQATGADVTMMSVPQVDFRNMGKQCALAKGRSLCDIAEDQGVGIKAQCHEGKCGSDPLRIISGQEHLNKITEMEASTLDLLGLEAGEYRLACVTRATGPVVVEVLDPA